MVAGKCVGKQAKDDGTACEDGDVTTADTCKKGKCTSEKTCTVVGTTNTTACNDGNDLTDGDVCTASKPHTTPPLPFFKLRQQSWC